MGAYINPPGQTKEAFLQEHGLSVEYNEARDWGNRPEGCLPVVLVNNGFFTAAGIAFSSEELGVFTDPQDMRPRKFFYVEKEKLMGVSDLRAYLKS